MKFEQVIMLVILAFVLYLAFRPNPSRRLPLVITDRDIPVTWNLDWAGGPGYDRHRILTKRGPYNPGGEERHRD